MTEISVPLFYHPTTTLFVDDDGTFLKSLSLNIDDDHCYSLCYDVEKAIDLVAEHHYDSALLDSIFQVNSSVDPGVMDQEWVEVKFNLDPFEFHSSKRFNIISSAVLDYTMPKKNGVELSRQFLEVSPCMKNIILTGTASPNIALDAFNTGSISGFVTKSTVEALPYINEKLGQFKWQSFIDLSAPYISLIQSKQSTFLNEEFKLCLLSFMKKHSIQEYYPMDINGSLKMYNEDGEVYHFIIRHKDELENYAVFAQEEGADEETIRRIRLLQSVPVHIEKNLKPENTHKNWEVSAQIERIPGSLDYYCYFYRTEAKKALSFNSFIQDHWPEY